MDPMLLVDRIFQYGLPTVILAAFCWAAWRASVWTGANMVIPLRDRAIAHLDATTSTMERLAETSEEQGKLLAQQGLLLTELIASLAQLKKSMGDVKCHAAPPTPENHKLP